MRLILIWMAIATLLIACSPTENAPSSVKNSQTKEIINVDLGADIATLDPQLTEDTQSVRVANDLFEGLTSFDQSNQAVPGLAESWQISGDGKTYTFYLRPGIKFSNGSPIRTDDILFTFQRLAAPATASPYSFLLSNLVNGQDIIAGKLVPERLGITALNPTTIQIRLVHPDPSFLSICNQAQLGIVSKATLKKHANAWTNEKNLVSSGAYQLKTRIVNGYILIEKNPYYYAESSVNIPKVKFFPIVDGNSSLNQYKAGNLDITYTLPIDQYKEIKQQMPEQEHTVTWETIEYLDFNMNSPKFKNNLKLRQALSIAIDRNTIVKQVMGQGQTILFSYATPTVEGGKFADLVYPWASWPRERQIAYAKQLFSEAGYNSQHPLSITISYNTNDGHKKKALAISAMWQQVFGSSSIQVTSNNQEWKTFLQSRHNGDYDVARDGWVADYDSVDSYTALYQCGNPQNNAKACTPRYNQLLEQAQTSSEPETRIKLLHQALQLAMDNYAIIPLYQSTYFRLVNPQIKNYFIERNHLDHVMSKWYAMESQITTY